MKRRIRKRTASLLTFVMEFICLKEGIVALFRMTGEPADETDDRMEIRVDHAGEFDEDPGQETQYGQEKETGASMEIHQYGIAAEEEGDEVEDQDRIAVRESQFIHDDVMQMGFVCFRDPAVCDLPADDRQ